MILMISSELPEALRMSHRILVMCEGRIAGELPAGASQEQIMAYATRRTGARTEHGQPPAREGRDPGVSRAR
jgi:ribose transport system ATP-binding protein